MNWMIDGAYGDLYRTAMGQTQRVHATDEWDIERRMAEDRPKKRRSLAARFRLLRRVLRSYGRTQEQQSQIDIAGGFLS